MSRENVNLFFKKCDTHFVYQSIFFSENFDTKAILIFMFENIITHATNSHVGTHVEWTIPKSMYRCALCVQCEEADFLGPPCMCADSLRNSLDTYI